MKKHFGQAIVFAGFLISGSAVAGTAATTLDVSASVPGTCTVSANPLNFGEINGPNAGFATGNVSVTCSAGITYFVGMDQGQHFNPGAVLRAMQNGAGDPLHYSIVKTSNGGGSWGDLQIPGGNFPADAAQGIGSGSAQSITYQAQTTQTGGSILTAGTAYSDTINITVEF